MNPLQFDFVVPFLPLATSSWYTFQWFGLHAGQEGDGCQINSDP